MAWIAHGGRGMVTWAGHMGEQELSAIEVAARMRWQGGDYQSCATVVFDGYGAELYSFLVARFHGNTSHADEAFSEFSEDFWRALPKFGWRCSIRAWCYKLTRSAAYRLQRSPLNQRGRRLSLSSVPWLDGVADQARTTTLPHFRTEVKDEFQKLRDKLSPEDQDLLILRVDRDLSWRDVAHALQDTDVEEELDRGTEAVLRQRFVEVKKRLKRLANEAGLLSTGER
jgi:RNA polymerase sigma-70 factor (ECF subfamily)